MIRQAIGKQGQLAHSTLRLHWTPLRACLSQALPDELIADHPATRIGKLLRKLQKPVAIFTPTALTHLLKACLATMPAYDPLLLLLARTGLRLGEALALQVGDINLPDRHLTVWRT